MELRPDQLAAQAAGQPLRPVYLVAGSETLLVLEAADAIRARARSEGIEREGCRREDGEDNLVPRGRCRPVTGGSEHCGE